MNSEDLTKIGTNVGKAIREQVTGGKKMHNWPVRLLGTALGVGFLHAAAVFSGVTIETSWSSFIEFLWNSPVLGIGTYLLMTAFWAGILCTVRGGQFVRIFFRGVTIPLYLYFFVGRLMW